MLHIRPNGLLELEKSVTVGHGALVHGQLIKTFAVIGIGSVVGFDVVVGTWSIIAEGCVLTKNTIVPDEKIVAGVPGKIIGDTLEKHKKFWIYGKQLYVDLAHEYPEKTPPPDKLISLFGNADKFAKDGVSLALKAGSMGILFNNTKENNYAGSYVTGSDFKKSRKIVS